MTSRNSSSDDSNQCRVCGNKHFSSILSCPNLRQAEEEYFDYMQCSKCRSLSLIDIPENISAYYDNYYSLGPVKRDIPLRRLLKKWLFSSNRVKQKIAKKGLRRSIDLEFIALSSVRPALNQKILDIGCGSGQMLCDLQEIGFSDLLGIDPFIEEDICYPTGVQILKRSIFELSGQWDIILLNHVFEHMEDLEGVLKKLRELLDSKGTILLRIPNVDSYAFRFFRENWYGIQAPLHYALPSVDGIKGLTDRAGLKIQSLKGENVLEFWLHSVAYKLRIWDYHKFGIRTFLDNAKILFPIPIISDFDKSRWKSLNKRIVKYPELCDWITYRITH
jgi:SAM-dependent methyltransferase